MRSALILLRIIRVGGVKDLMKKVARGGRRTRNEEEGDGDIALPQNTSNCDVTADKASNM